MVNSYYYYELMNRRQWRGREKGERRKREFFR
jgi:hypothetical protein